MLVREALDHLSYLYTWHNRSNSMVCPEKYAHFQQALSPSAVFSCSGDSKQDKCQLGKGLDPCTGRVATNHPVP